jgi:hypothetical protein
MPEELTFRQKEEVERLAADVLSRCQARRSSSPRCLPALPLRLLRLCLLPLRLPLRLLLRLLPLPARCCLTGWPGDGTTPALSPPPRPPPPLAR